ncbi:pentatricopeptide repeat-containing protein At1g31430-like [Impatiens glandulifera]|uniref:pentatricopeptide repeat-containing protein At1g31430-like n=1 Tax=Impatiens glandulifera TaxID=253017 RepID=UPI001FB18B5A|nr:pentatricopeptide repeat-containing protein At1g31430-like [Impatiens glandulifera]
MFIPSHFVGKSVGRLTKKECIQYLKNCKSMVGLQQIHSQIIKIGFHQDIDALDKLIVFCADTSLGNLPYAERIFNYAEYPSLFIYNVMIKAYAKNSSYRKSILLFDELRIEGLWPDNFTYPFVLKSVAQISNVSLGKKIHGFAVKTGAEFDCYVCNSLMDMYSELGQLEYVQKLFDGMPNRDVVSWNVLISGYVKCRKFEEAVNVFYRMRSENAIKPDEATVVSTLSACTNLKRLDLGEEIHSIVRDEFELGFTPIISNALLDMYSKCGHLSIARQMFDEMPVKNVICWTAMVSGYVGSGKLDKARSLFERSPSKDVILWTTMINGYVQFNQFDEAIALFHRMQIQRVKPDKFTLVAILTGCAQSGALEQGRWIHGYIEVNRIKLDAIIGTALIDMYAKCGCVVKSLEIFNRMNRHEKDTASWTSIICGLALNGQTDKALVLFSEMKRDGFRPDDITFIGVLTACSHGGLVNEGLIHFESMKRNYQIEPKLEHYGCVIDLLGRSGRLDEAEEMIERAPNEDIEIVIPLYGALLSACRTYGNVKMGERMGKKLAEIETKDSSVHTLLANIYASANRWADVTKVRRRMRDAGVKKEPGCSSIEIDGNIHEFLVRDTSHSEIQDVHSMLHSITKVVTDLGELQFEEDI